MTKIEKVARAIGTKRGDYSEAGWLGLETHAMTIDQARAAVGALREPTSYMIAAAAEKTGQQTYGDTWRAMIDAILNETI